MREMMKIVVVCSFWFLNKVYFTAGHVNIFLFSVKIANLLMFATKKVSFVVVLS